MRKGRQRGGPIPFSARRAAPAENAKAIAVRPAEARAKSLPEPTDPTRHASVKDPS